MNVIEDIMRQLQSADVTPNEKYWLMEDVLGQPEKKNAIREFLKRDDEFAARLVFEIFQWWSEQDPSGNLAYAKKDWFLMNYGISHTDLIEHYPPGFLAYLFVATAAGAPVGIPIRE